MKETAPTQGTWRGFTRHHSKVTLLGLGVVVVPVVIMAKSIEQSHKALNKAVDLVGAGAPAVDMLGGPGLAIALLLLIVGACWALGWLVTRTKRGAKLIEWEESSLLPRSPLLQEKVKKLKEQAPDPSKAQAPSKDPQPALAHVAGGWQPCVVIEERADGWATVFVPDIPSVSKGRLYCLAEDQVLRLEVTLDAYREQLTASGHGSEDWLQALSEANPNPGEIAS